MLLVSRIPLLSASPLTLQPFTNKMAEEGPFAKHWSLAGRTYIARKVGHPITIDGDLEKPEWTEVEWSEPFGDIRGAADAPPEEQPTGAQQTRMKMRWDKDYLYVAAHIQSDFPVLASFTKRNDPIFTKDSDFEVFVDPGATTHAYKELEINALGTVWNLMLNRAYGDGGGEHSARVAKKGEQKYYEVEGLKSATKVVQGKLGDKGGAEWTVELAMAHDDTLRGQPDFAERPNAGGLWRINFSRVEKKGDVNWVWSPQIVWDAKLRQHVGKVAMHLPDAWGWVQFAPKEGAEKVYDVSWPARLAALNVYYAQQQHKADKGQFAAVESNLRPYLDHEIMAPFHLGLEADKNLTFSATIMYGTSAGQLYRCVHIREDRLVRVVEGGSSSCHPGGEDDHGGPRGLTDLEKEKKAEELKESEAAQRAEAKALDEKAKREEEGQIAINAEEAAIATAEADNEKREAEELKKEGKGPKKAP